MGRRAIASPPPGIRVAAMLACALWVLWSNAPDAWAQMAVRGEKGAAVEELDAEDKQEALRALMEDRRAVRGRTARGQTIEDAPPFTATEREWELEYFPCSDCHEDQATDPRVRELEDEHDDLVFHHGGGRFWCYDACHNADRMDSLRLMLGAEVSFNESYRLCGQCHFQRQKDWYFGGHGKRSGAWLYQREIPVSHEELVVEDREAIGTWRDERVLLACPACHNAHSPSIKPYEPSPPPQVRSGLEREPPEEPVHGRVWEEMQNGHEESE